MIKITERKEMETITSMEVAEMVEKDHSKLLRDIRVYTEQLAEAKIGLGDFFTESTYQDGNNQTRPCYNVTKKGCEFISNKLTGVKGTKFTARYINRFHDMEDIIKQPKTPLQILELEFAAIKEVDIKVDMVNADLQEFKKNLPLLPAEAETLVDGVNKKVISILSGKNSNAYTDSSLRGKVYKDIYRELKRQFGVSKYKYIKSNQLNAALNVVKNYQLPISLKEMVSDSNSQIKMAV